MFSCGLACCEVIPMALIDVFCLLMMMIYVVYELMIWLVFGMSSSQSFSEMSSCELAYCGVIPV
jgi:hypothetical protein